jgi:hypothetical protein
MPDVTESVLPGLRTRKERMRKDRPGIRLLGFIEELDVARYTSRRPAGKRGVLQTLCVITYRSQELRMRLALTQRKVPYLSNLCC